MVTYQGVSKVVDFGVAKAKTQVAATETGAFKGKISYMAPEQVWSRHVDRRADLWSSGMVLYEGITGSSLFRKYSDPETLTHLMSTPIEPLVALPLRRAKRTRESGSRDPAPGIRRRESPPPSSYVGCLRSTWRGNRRHAKTWVRTCGVHSPTSSTENKQHIASLVEKADSEPPAQAPRSIPCRGRLGTTDTSVGERSKPCRLRHVPDAVQPPAGRHEVGASPNGPR